MGLFSPSSSLKMAEVEELEQTVEVKLFNKWSFEQVEVSDISLEDYIAVKQKFASTLPHTAGRYQVKRFRKAQCPIVQRLVNAIINGGPREDSTRIGSAGTVRRQAVDVS